MKTRQDSTGREVCDIEFSQCWGRDTDTHVLSATYLDDVSPVGKDELAKLFLGECLCRDCVRGL